MKETLFRGKDVKTNKWVYGYYSKSSPSCTTNTNYWIISNRKWFNIHRKTLGQSIGIKDGNDQILFDGDIVKGTCSKNRERCCQGIIQGDLVGKEVKGTIQYSNLYCQFYFTTDDITYLDLAFGLENIVKIGNIHENPEVLKSDAT